jgi:hypothetical protein
VDKLTPVFSGAGVLPPSVTAGGISSSGGGVTDAVSFSDTGVAGGVSSSGDDVTGAASFVPGAGGLFPAAPHSLGRLGGIVKIPITNISRLAVISTAIKPFFIKSILLDSLYPGRSEVCSNRFHFHPPFHGWF